MAGWKSPANMNVEEMSLSVTGVYTNTPFLYPFVVLFRSLRFYHLHWLPRDLLGLHLLQSP